MRNAFTMALLAVATIVSNCAGQCGTSPTDRDGDCIEDAFEDQLLTRFRPIIVTDQVQGGPSEFRAIPANASYFLQQCDLTLPGPQGGSTVLVSRPSVDQLSAIVDAFDPEVASQLQLDFINENAKWGGVPFGHPSGMPWNDAIANGHGVYGRVFRPFAAQYPQYYSVQYYFLFTWNETGDCDVFNSYRHDGDIVCLDYGVDLSWDGVPRIVHAIYHVHGERSYITREALTFSAERPYAFLERGTQEPWPNADTDGAAGWPDTDG
ncbi:MAG: hypothetical protein ACOYN0_20075, partial [Phycisphaerales bacterium]